MAELRYGWVEGRGHGREVPFAASQTLSRRGGKFVYMDAAGKATRCASSTYMVFGWAETPKDVSGQTYWTSSAGDKVFVIDGLDDVYEVPAAATVDASWVGRGAEATVTASVQRVAITNSASPLSVVGIDTDKNTAFVKIKTSAKQAK